MKWIRYRIHQSGDITLPKCMAWTEVNEELARAEAFNGEYIVEDDGEPEPVPVPSDAERIAELEAALDMLLSGVTE